MTPEHVQRSRQEAALLQRPDALDRRRKREDLIGFLIAILAFFGLIWLCVAATERYRAVHGLPCLSKPCPPPPPAEAVPE